jgi:hypothetical protein
MEGAGFSETLVPIKQATQHLIQKDHTLHIHCRENVKLTSCRVFIEVTGGWRKLHNEELHNLYSSPSIIRMIKSRRMRWAGHVAQMGEKRNAYRILVGNSEETTGKTKT